MTAGQWSPSCPKWCCIPWRWRDWTEWGCQHLVANGWVWLCKFSLSMRLQTCLLFTSAHWNIITLQNQEMDRPSDVSGSQFGYNGVGHMSNGGSSVVNVHPHSHNNHTTRSIHETDDASAMLNHSYSKLSDSFGSPNSQPYFPDPSGKLVLSSLI